MNRQWGYNQNNPYYVVPPQFPSNFPVQQASYQNSFSSPYDYFQKPPIPVPNYGQQQKGGFKGGNPIMHQFQNQNGQMDFDKIFSTVGQFVNTVQQVQPLVKQVGSFMQGFNK